MQKYVIERELTGAGALSEDEVRAMSLRSIAALGELGSRIQWMHSFVTDNKLYCVYLAADEETIREHARRAGLPADRIAAVRKLIDPVNYA
jgi:Nickel responsive protein SCO4226-like